MGMIPLLYIPLKIVIAQFDSKKRKPVCTDGIREISSPSFDRSNSFCVSNPQPSPTSKLNDGPAKLLNTGERKMNSDKSSFTTHLTTNPVVLTMLPYSYQQGLAEQELHS